MPAVAPPPRRADALADLAAEALAALRFYTRLPLPDYRFEAAHAPQPFARALRWAPVAGVVVGLFGAAALIVAGIFGFPPLVAAALALVATVLITGGLHEDGLADVADGFGGGATRERKLAIMRDSRLGTYGALAVGFSLLLRAAALATLVARGGVSTAALAMVAAAASSRAFGLLPLAMLPPARPDGLAHGAGPLPRGTLSAACGAGALFGIGALALAGTGLGPSVLALMLAVAASLCLAGVAKRQIGGVTGDVAGAAQQACEIAVLLGLLVRPATS